jgi:hypothetical protein
MKKFSMFLSVCLIVLSFGAFAQLKVSSTGKVGIGIDPNASYNLSTQTAIFTTAGYSSYSDLVISYDPANYGKAIYPSLNNKCTVGTSANQFYTVYAQYHYANTNLLTSDKRLKENFRTIDQPLTKILQMNGQKYDFISQGTDTIKNEIEKQKRLRLEKNRLGFIAQDLEKILPEAVFYFKDEDRYYIDYNAVLPVLVEAMKAQQGQIEVLKSEVESCCKSNLKSASLTEVPTNNLAENVAQLDQNVPNPFSQETKIGCFIPDGSGNSVLYIYNMNGTQLQQYSITGKGKQTVTINGNSYEPGMYLYALVIDGKEVDTKRMILTK